MKSSAYGVFGPIVFLLLTVALSDGIKHSASAADPVPTQSLPVAPTELVGDGAVTLAQTEIAFAKMSVTEGVVKAFGAFLADDALADLARLDKNKMELNWRPTRAEVAAADGNLGYTFGVWELRIRGQPKILATGNYTTVWRKIPPASVGGEAKWLAILDTGNQSSRGPD